MTGEDREEKLIKRLMIAFLAFVVAVAIFGCYEYYKAGCGHHPNTPECTLDR